MELNDIPKPRLARWVKLLGDQQVRELFASGGLPLLCLSANRALRASKSLWRRENQSSEVIYTGPIIIGHRLAEAMIGAPILITDNVAVDGKIVASPIVIVDMRRIDWRTEHMAEVIWTGDHARIYIWQPTEWRADPTYCDLLEITDEPALAGHRVTDYDLAPFDYSLYSQYYCDPSGNSQYCDPTYDLPPSEAEI